MRTKERSRKVYKAICYSSAMVKQVTFHDAENYVMLAVARLHDLDTIRELVPKTPRRFRPKNLEFTSREDATAWVATACCRRLSYFMRNECGGAEAAANMPLQTWILGPQCQPYAALSQVFGWEGETSDLRILVHRTPLTYKDRSVRPCWYGVYSGRGKVIRKRESLSGEVVRVAKPFLHRVLDAYAAGTSVADLMARTGHPYWGSDGRSSFPW